MLRHAALHKDGRFCWIQASGQKIKRDLKRIGRNFRCVGVIRGKRVQVGDEEETVVGVLSCSFTQLANAPI